MKTKTSILLLLTLCGYLFSATARAEFVPPTEAQINQALANTDLLASLLEDADGAQAADVIKQLIDKIIASEKLNAIQKEYNISFFVARAVQLMGNKRLDYATALLGMDLGEYRITIIAALSVGGTGSNAFKDDLVALLGENQDEIDAVREPQSTITGQVYNRLIARLGIANALPPAAGSPPPVAVPYQGQRPR